MNVQARQSYGEATALAQRIAERGSEGAIWAWEAIGLQRVGDTGRWAVAVMQRRDATIMPPNWWPEVVCVSNWEEWLRVRTLWR